MAVAACVLALCVVKWDPSTPPPLYSSWPLVSTIRLFRTPESVQNRTSPEALPIPTASDFVAIREAYFAAKANSRDPYDEEVDAAFRENPSGAHYFVPLEIRVSTFGGRGLFTKQPVAKGQPVSGYIPSGIFRSEDEWRRFLELLPSDHLRYDAVVWSYVLLWMDEDEENRNKDQETFVVALDLDERSLLNHGILTAVESSPTSPILNSHGLHALSAGDANVQENDEDYLIATRDIVGGEELFSDYGTFHQSEHPLKWYKQTWDEIIGTK